MRSKEGRLSVFKWSHLMVLWFSTIGVIIHALLNNLYDKNIIIKYFGV